jgi:hypothetical protein
MPPRGPPSRHGHLLKDPDVARWHANVARGSVITADVYLRRLGVFCAEHKTKPVALAKLTET